MIVQIDSLIEARVPELGIKIGDYEFVVNHKFLMTSDKQWRTSLAYF